jgi:hypothetical protein
MKNTNIYAGYRYPSQIISHAVWLYHRFTLHTAVRKQPMRVIPLTWSATGEADEEI